MSLSFGPCCLVLYIIMYFVFRMCEGSNINKAIELYQSAGELREVFGDFVEHNSHAVLKDR